MSAWDATSGGIHYGCTCGDWVQDWPPFLSKSSCREVSNLPKYAHTGNRQSPPVGSCPVSPPRPYARNRNGVSLFEHADTAIRYSPQSLNDARMYCPPPIIGAHHPICVSSNTNRVYFYTVRQLLRRRPSRGARRNPRIIRFWWEATYPAAVCE